MEKFKGFYKKNIKERRKIIQEKSSRILDFEDTLKEEVYDKMIENAITTYQIPMGIVTQFPLNGHFHTIPMVTEEPSVVAAANNAAKIISQNNGIKASVISRIMRGEIVYSNPSKQLIKEMNENLDDIIKVANTMHPSIVKRGGGVTEIQLREIIDESISFLILDVFVNTKEAMGANIINTILEGLAHYLETQYDAKSMMSILSNLSSEALVYAQCQIDPKTLKFSDGIINKFVEASELARLDPYRATTHNKGIMNGIDALVIASGNDWRATEAAMHAYASRNGSYQGLTRWYEDTGFLVGEIEIPVPIGTVGGTIPLHPTAQMSYQIMEHPDAEQLMMLIAGLGLAQNFAALYALVTDGIQKGHMSLHAKTVALNAGATEDNLQEVLDLLLKEDHINIANAKEIISKLKSSE